MLAKRRLKKAVQDNDITTARKILRSNPYLADVDVLLSVGRSGAPAMAEMFAQEIHLHVELTKEKWMFLHIIAEFHYVEAARIALGRRPSIVDKQTKFGTTPLHVAATVGDSEMVALLVVCGADVNAADGEGCTALHMAIKRGHIALFESLLSYGADATKRDDKGRTPLDCATHDRCTVAVIDGLRQKVAENTVALPAQVEAVQQRPLSPWHVVDDCTIAYTREDALLGYRLTEVFNFGIGRCISIQHHLQTGAQTAVSTDMAEISGRALLLQARDELCAQGHNPPPLMLPAPQPLLKKPQAGGDV